MTKFWSSGTAHLELGHRHLLEGFTCVVRLQRQFPQLRTHSFTSFVLIEREAVRPPPSCLQLPTKLLGKAHELCEWLIPLLLEDAILKHPYLLLVSGDATSISTPGHTTVAQLPRLN